MKTQNIKWFYLILLSLVWGSSFILIDFSLKGLTPIQVGCFRILISAIILIIVGYKSLLKLNKKEWYWITVNALLGTFFPAFLFAFAINSLDSAITAILNSLTPLNTLIFGFLLFGFGFKKRQLFGVLIGLVGTVLLIYFSKDISSNNSLFYISLVIIASMGYAINVNVIKKYLNDVRPIAITAGNFVVLIVPTIIILLFSLKIEGFDFNIQTNKSLLYITILSIFGTAIAKTLFNKLVQISSPLFSTSVTYLIPIIAVFWGIYFGEKLNLNQLIAGLIILLGVYLANRVRKQPS